MAQLKGTTTQSTEEENPTTTIQAIYDHEISGSKHKKEPSWKEGGKKLPKI